MRFKQEGVWLADPGVVHFTAKDAAFIVEQAPLTAKRRARICAHDFDSRMHQMLIAFCVDSWNSEHSHDAPESILVIRGMMSVKFPVSEKLVILHAGDFLRIPAGIVHQPLPLTDCVILESAEK